MSKHYDVVVLGAGLGALTAAALLARRSWRVLVLGHGYRPQFYSYDGLPLARRPFTFVAQSSPAWGRVLAELAQSQTFRRKVTPLDPMFQVLAPGMRFDVPSEPARFAAEVDREFPAARRVIDTFYGELAKTNAAADAVFAGDTMWPPASFWERREATRAIEGLPQIESDRDLLAEFPRGHQYRTVVTAPARFSSHASKLSPFALARLHGDWTRGLMRLEGGEPSLIDFLVERVRAQGGDAELGERATRIVHKRGRAHAVMTDGREDPIGVQFVVAGLPGRPLVDLAPDLDPSSAPVEGGVQPAEARFVVSAVVREEGIPAPLADEAFLVSSASRHAFAGRLDAKSDRARIDRVVHLQQIRSKKGGLRLLVAEALLTDTSAATVSAARERVLGAIEEYCPFIERHYVLVDSPHDKRPLWDYRSGTRKLVDRALVRATGGSVDAEPMAIRWDVTDPAFFGLGGEPVRTPLSGAFCVGTTILPALGQEGEMLAASTVARLITRTDARKEKMRREMWTKVEIG